MTSNKGLGRYTIEQLRMELERKRTENAVMSPMLIGYSADDLEKEIKRREETGDDGC